MRAVKLLSVLLVAIVFALALAPTGRFGVWAQLPPSNPAVAPIGEPSAPAQLQAPGQALAIPSLAPVGASPAATPAPATTARIFNCSCYGVGTHVSWMGTVNAASYFAARQAATGTCVTFNTNRAPESPYISPSTIGLTSPPLAPGAVSLVPGTTSPALPGELNFSATAQLAMCSTCSCD